MIIMMMCLFHIMMMCLSLLLPALLPQTSAPFIPVVCTFLLCHAACLPAFFSCQLLLLPPVPALLPQCLAFTFEYFLAIGTVAILLGGPAWAFSVWRWQWRIGAEVVPETTPQHRHLHREVARHSFRIQMLCAP